MRNLILILSLCLCFLFSACHKTESYETGTGISSISSDLLKPNWQEAYFDYLNKEDISYYYGFYIGDVNRDNIPEIVLRYNEFTNSGAILYFAGVELQVLELDVVSTWGNVGYLEETNQIILLQWYGHTQGTFGSVNFYLYEWTPDGYAETISVIRESGYGITEEYGQGYINGKEVDFDDFEVILAEMYALLEKSTWFPMIAFDEVDNYSDYFTQWEMANSNQ